MFNSFDYQVKKGETITYPENKERGYFYSPGKSCEEQKELIVVTNIKGYIETKQRNNRRISWEKWEQSILTFFESMEGENQETLYSWQE